MTRKTKIAVFASGSGSNFAAIEEACRNGELNAEIALVVTNKPDAYVVERAEKLIFQLPRFALKTTRLENFMRRQF